IPKIAVDLVESLEDIGIKFGIADGGHSHEVVKRAVLRLPELQKSEGWREPFIRVHFIATDREQLEDIDQVVEALNTSLQVQQYTRDEYQNKFEELKEALSKAGFDTSLIAFRENEEKEWHVIEIIQRLACFLKDRWQLTQPASMYKSKATALALYT